MSHRLLADGLTNAFLAGGWTAEELTFNASAALGTEKCPAWARALASRVLELFPAAPRDAPSEVADIIEALVPRLLVRHRVRATPRVVVWRHARQAMGPTPWPVPDLASAGDVADWLGVDGRTLGALADRNGLARHGTTPLDSHQRHYLLRWIAKRSGGARLLEAPKARLKSAQRKILSDILDRIPAHEAAHGFTRGRSPATHASPHVAKATVLKLDLEDFFASISAAQVRAIFRAAGYPESVAQTLSALCTSRVPEAVWSAPGAPTPTDALGLQARYRQRRRLLAPHLPQGAPTSPALANLGAYRLDVRLSAFAAASECTYTRYADDLAFSGGPDLGRSATRFIRLVTKIVADAGFRVNAAKTRLMRSAGRQELAGVVVNHHPTVARREVERLEAILHNCAVQGPSTQNRDRHPRFREHLRGRVAHVAALDPRRGELLLQRYLRIVWPEDAPSGR